MFSRCSSVNIILTYYPLTLALTLTLALCPHPGSALTLILASCLHPSWTLTLAIAITLTLASCLHSCSWFIWHNENCHLVALDATANSQKWAFCVLCFHRKPEVLWGAIVRHAEECSCRFVAYGCCKKGQSVSPVQLLLYLGCEVPFCCGNVCSDCEYVVL